MIYQVIYKEEGLGYFDEPTTIILLRSNSKIKAYKHWGPGPFDRTEVKVKEEIIFEPIHQGQPQAYYTLDYKGYAAAFNTLADLSGFINLLNVNIDDCNLVSPQGNTLKVKKKSTLEEVK